MNEKRPGIWQVLPTKIALSQKYDRFRSDSTNGINSSISGRQEPEYLPDFGQMLGLVSVNVYPNRPNEQLINELSRQNKLMASYGLKI